MSSLFTIDDAFWSPRLETWRTVTLPHVMQQCEDTGRLRNFDRAAGLLSDEFEGRMYDDSDVYKTLEGVAHANALQPDAGLGLRAADWVARIAAAQRPDGYLHTWHQTHPDATPFEDAGSRHELYCAGHLLEAGLALHAATGEERLLEVAQRFVDHIREHLGPDGRREPPGHPELELALLRLHGATGDESDLDAVWRDLTSSRMYVTGGVGNSADAHAETCAAIGLVLLSKRLTDLDGDSATADVMERALFNGVLAGISLSGDRFFCANPLASRGDREREPFFERACCPTNLARFLPAVDRLFASRTPDGARLDMYAAGRLTLDGTAIRIVTGYPWAGGVRLQVEEGEARSFVLRLRVPDWSPRHSVRVNGQYAQPPLQKGYVVLDRTWRPGDTIDLDLSMPIERVRADEQVVSARGRVALRRGPLVYCVEGVDHGGHVDDLVLPPTNPLEAVIRPRHLGGVITLACEARREGRPLLLEAVPYFAWQNRDVGTMRVWLPETPEALA